MAKERAHRQTPAPTGPNPWPKAAESSPSPEPDFAEKPAIDPYGQPITNHTGRLSGHPSGLMEPPGTSIGELNMSSLPAAREPDEVIEPIEPLTPQEAEQFNELEQVVESGLQIFFEVGTALSIIRGGRLYRDSHDRFEDYCRARWGIQASRARQLILSSEIFNDLKSVTIVTLPKNEAQVRPLLRCPEELRQAAWERAVESAEGKGVTGTVVKDAVTEMLGGPVKKEKLTKKDLADDTRMDEAAKKLLGKLWTLVDEFRQMDLSQSSRRAVLGYVDLLRGAVIKANKG